MTDNHIYKLVDLVEEIRKLDRTIQTHQASESANELMIGQYQSKKAKLVSYLIRDLSTPALRSPKAFVILRQLLENFYPESKLPNSDSTDATDATLQELNKLEYALNR